MEENKKQHDKDIEHMKQMLEEIAESNRLVDEKLDAVLEEIDYLHKDNQHVDDWY